jgi:hypothetical protein
MADRINDTDPQSPHALSARTDPGLGSPPVHASPHLPPARPFAAAPPAPGPASIEELIDGITGPRPPPSRRESAGADSARAYSAARPVPTPRAMGPREPLVVSPEPPLYSGAGSVPRHATEEMPRGPDPASTRPVVRAARHGEGASGAAGRPADALTVYTGRRALLRNVGVALASAAAVAVMMVTIMRWKEAHRPPRAPEVVVLPAVPDSEPSVAPQAVVAAAAIAPAPAVPATSDPAPAAAPAVTASAARPAAPAPRRPRTTLEAKPKAPESLDDLNRQISH